MSSARHPGLIASYRLQLSREFGFDHAITVLPYLAKLGISHLYLSPILQAAEGSSHGYDVIDHNRISEELGGEAGYARLCSAAKALGLQQIIDIVPNHMSIRDRRNTWWWDLLEDGPKSRYASAFDVDWDPPEAKNRNVLLLPILGDHRGKVLDRHEITVVRDGGRFVFAYREHAAPVAFDAIGQVLNTTAERGGLAPEVAAKLTFFANAYTAVPAPSGKDAVHRTQYKRVLSELISAFFKEAPSAGRAVDTTLAELSDDPAALDAFLNLQNHRLAYWKTGDRELDYRRFFDVNSLVGLRVEQEDVFLETHRTIARLIADGCVDGLRVDHIDGLADPQKYLERLRALAPNAWVVVEKILGPDERLRSGWPVHGTTGYDFMNELSGLFIDPTAEVAFTKLFVDVTGEARGFLDVAHEKKDAALKEALAADVDRLTQVLSEATAATRMYRDYTRFDLRQALRAFIAAFPVYRSYVSADGPTADDVSWVAQAVALATKRRPELDPALFTLISGCLLQAPGAVQPPLFGQRLQQLTSPTMAKGVEDAAFYAWSRFIALNEVGGHPEMFGTTVARFHEQNRLAAAQTPSRMLATSTHDTKRSADVRARLAALTETPAAWAKAVTEWQAHNAPKRRHGAPDGDTEYLFYQTLVGAWPIDLSRAQTFMRKAIRESKTRTSWVSPNEVYEAGVEAFVAACFADADFVTQVARMAQALKPAGEINTLAQTLLALTSPGVPDLYQGAELFTFDLVDPDNRRAVDWPRRAAFLAEASTASAAHALARGDLAKMMLIERTLSLRRRRPAAFDGRYEPLLTDVDHLVAYQRGEEVIAIAPRLTNGAPHTVHATLRLPAGHWANVLTKETLAGSRLDIGAQLARFPVALLERTGGPS